MISFCYIRVTTKPMTHIGLGKCLQKIGIRSTRFDATSLIALQRPSYLLSGIRRRRKNSRKFITVCNKDKCAQRMNGLGCKTTQQGSFPNWNINENIQYMNNPQNFRLQFQGQLSNFI